HRQGLPGRTRTREGLPTPRARSPSLAEIVRGGPRPGCFRSGALFRVFHSACLADDRDLDLAWVLKRVLDLLRDVAREARGLKIVELFRLHHDTNLATRLYRERLLNAGEAVRHALELLQARDVVRDDLAPRPGTRGADGVGGRDERANHRHRFHVAVMAADAVDDRLREAVALEELAADHRVRPFDLVVDRLADVVQQTGALHGLRV